MVLKRKRNLKIDSTSTYSVFLLRDMDKSEIEDYVENRDTGMEAEEEKEVHLQNIIKGTGKEIPIPVIVELENISRNFYEKKELKRKICWEKDCPNEYIENKEEEDIEKVVEIKIQEALIRNNTEKSSFIPIEQLGVLNTVIDPIGQTLTSPTEPEIMPDQNKVQKQQLNIYKIEDRKVTLKDVIRKIGNEKNAFGIKDEEIISFCLKKTLVRYEKTGFEAYACFRDRIFNPTFKSRRNEALMLEKINRMGVEFNTLKKLCENYNEKSVDEERMYGKTIKIYKKICLSKISKRKKRILVQKMYKQSEKGFNSKIKVNIYDLLIDRQRIANLRNMKTTNELFLDIKYYNEIMNLVKSEEKNRDKEEMKKR